MASQLPGIERIKTRFLDLLAERQTTIASHTLAAWDGNDLPTQHSEMLVVQGVLHQIAGSAGTLGFTELGKAAFGCESMILEYTQKGVGHSKIPHDIFVELDAFVAISQALLTSAAQLPKTTAAS